jgi:hypothetical protein
MLTDRLGRRPLTLAAVGVSIWLVLEARETHVSPSDLPSGDAAYYMAQALELRALMVDGAWGQLLARVSWPELHPFGHPLLLAFWSLIAGVGQTALRSYGVAMSALGLLVLLPLLGRAVARTTGLWVGLCTGLLLLAGPFQQQHLFTCMTEPSTLVSWLLFLLLAVHGWREGRPRAWLLTGTGLLLTGLIRYSSPLLLLPPLLLTDLLTQRDALRPRALRWACWLGPTLAAFCLWWAVEPALPQAVASFLISAQPAGDSAIGWLWPAWAYGARSLGSPWLAVLLLTLAAAGGLTWLGRTERPWTLGPVTIELNARREPGLALLQLTALLVTLALSAHPFKVTRNIGAVAPLLTLAALLPWLGLRLRMGERDPTRWVGLAFAALVLLPPLQAAKSPRDLTPSGGNGRRLAAMTNEFPDHPPQPELVEVFALIDEAWVPSNPHGPGTRWLLVRGWGLSDALLRVHAAEVGLEAQLITHWDPAGLEASPELPTPDAGHAVAVLITPPFPPRKKGERDDLAETRGVLMDAGFELTRRNTTPQGWRVERLEDWRGSLQSAPLPFGREQLIQRELRQRR